MKIFRFIVPFLFVRNWYTGEWELSRPRVFLVVCGGILVLSAWVVIYVLGAPVVYTVT